VRGSVYSRVLKTKNGKPVTVYDVVFDVGRDPVTGKRKQKRMRGFKTKKEAEKALAQAIAEVERGTYLDPAKMTVGEWLREWLKLIEDKNLSPSTLRGYRDIVEHHLIPALGSILLAKLQPIHLEQYYAKALREGRKDRKAKTLGASLKAQSVLHHHRILHRALAHAEKLDLIPRNPARRVEPPRPDHHEPATLSPEDARRSLDVLRGTYLYIPTLLAIATGMRRSEILGLRWQDVDLKAGTVMVRQTLLRGGVRWRPKTKKSARPIPLPPFVVRELKAHRKQQLEWKLKAGSAWHETDLVCTREDGSSINPDTLSGQFSKRLTRAGFPHVTFHGLRHSHGTLLMEWGVHPKVVSERLGHSSVKITLDIYSHVLPDTQEEAVRAVERALAGDRVCNPFANRRRTKRGGR